VFQEVTEVEGLFGERAGARTQDPVIKSHVRYKICPGHHALDRQSPNYIAILMV
jgi:hypothetical protein